MEPLLHQLRVRMACVFAAVPPAIGDTYQDKDDVSSTHGDGLQKKTPGSAAKVMEGVDFRLVNVRSNL